MQEEYILKVDFEDNYIDKVTKEEAHFNPILHRAFSVFLFSGNKVLLQRRAKGKYHSELLIANTCCSHPRTDNDILQQASKRLYEELGISFNKLKEVGSFTYCAKFNENLYEYEYDHILVGEVDENIEYNLNPQEVDSVFWVDIDKVKDDLVKNPQNYAVWFFEAFNIFLNYYNKYKLYF